MQMIIQKKRIKVQAVSDIVVKLLAAANYDVKKAENGIVIIDEIDKKA